MKHKISFVELVTCCLITGLLAMSAGCTSGQETSKGPTTVQSGLVTETIDAGKYTFVCINSEDQAFWLASRPIDAEIGDVLEYEGVSVMKDFYSATLDRTFPVILFVNRAWVARSSPTPTQRAATLPSGHPLVPVDQSIMDQSGSGNAVDVRAVQKDSGSYAISEVFEKGASLTGETIKVAGRVVKVNSNILGRNWIHLQDGTGGDEPYDLTVTSSEHVPVGSVVVAQGVVSSDKTLNGGYHFPLLLEEASISSPDSSVHQAP